MYDRSICTGDEKEINDSLESFPSGHTTAAFAGFVYLSLYLNAKLKVAANYHPALWKLVAVMAPLLGATLIGGALTIDEFHNWYDVLAGAIIGTLMAFTSYRMGKRPTYYLTSSSWPIPLKSQQLTLKENQYTHPSGTSASTTSPSGATCPSPTAPARPPSSSPASTTRCGRARRAGARPRRGRATAARPSTPAPPVVSPGLVELEASWLVLLSDLLPVIIVLVVVVVDMAILLVARRRGIASRGGRCRRQRTTGRRLSIWSRRRRVGERERESGILFLPLFLLDPLRPLLATRENRDSMRIPRRPPKAKVMITETPP